MTRIISLLNKGETIMERSEDALLSNIKDAEILIYDEIRKIFNSIDVEAGKIKTSTIAENFLMRLDEKIYSSLKKSGYSEAVKMFIKSFDEIEANIRDVHSAINKVNITSDQIKPYKRIEVENTLSKFAENSLTKDFIDPIRQSLYRNIITGASISEVEAFLKSEIITNPNSNGRLMKYVKQISRDSVSQFDGTVQQNIQKELGLNAITYVGSLMKDSRGQCVKWVTENGGIIKLSDLDEEIRWAKTKGSYYQTASGKIRTGGMIPETNQFNFLTYRGGYNCRHRAIATFRKF